MLPLDACAGRADVGGKAETLARVRAAGLRAADGFVVLADEVLDAATLARELERIGGTRYVVRSSSALEDRAGGSAAGLFLSLVDVAASEVAAAIAKVRASATSPALQAYLAARGFGDEAVRVAVLVQPLIVAPCFGVAHSAQDEFVIEERRAGEPEWGDVRARAVPREDAGELVSGLHTLEKIVGGPVDAELARDGELITWLQARPLTHAIMARDGRWTLNEPGRWRLDAEHNPQPLSAAQVSLVQLVERLGIGARQRIVEGYLYVESDAPPRGLSPILPSRLRDIFDRDIVPDCQRVLDAAESNGSLASALHAFAHVYRRYVGEISPSLAQVKHDLDQLLRVTLAESLAQHGELLAGLGGETLARDQALWELGRDLLTLDAYLARFSDHAPAWDVAVATDRECPERVLALARELTSAPAPMARHEGALSMAEQAAAITSVRLPQTARTRFVELLRLARQVLPIAEDDDLLFLRAQSTVRQALLHAARQLDLARPEDVFDLAIDDVRTVRHDLRVRAAANQAARRDAARRIPPLGFADGKPEWILPRAQDVLRGHGTAGHARGRAVIVRTLADAPSRLSPGSVLVVPAIIPSLTPLLPQAVALVTDHGGALSHGATLAREYGVPAVLGVRRATSLPDGVELYIDADSGRVLILDDV
jgi:phosphohistidine swiveling domain-containing protein